MITVMCFLIVCALIAYLGRLIATDSQQSTDSIERQYLAYLEARLDKTPVNPKGER